MKKKIFILIAVMMFSCLITFFTRPIQAYTFEKSASYSSSLSDFKNFEKELMSELNKSIIDVESINYDSDSYDSDSYSLEEVEDNSFNSCRLIVKGNISNTYGAYKDICGYLDYHILCYFTKEQTENAYNKLLADKVNVRPDMIVEAESASSENYQDYNTYNSWGAKYMDVAEYISYLKKINNTKEIVVAVLDTGINTSHEIFENRILKDSNNNLVGFAYYSSTYTYSGYEFEDDDGHGSHVSGTICELTPSNVKILPIKVLNDEGKAYDSQVLLGYTKIIEEYSLQYNIVCVSTSISGFQMYGSEYVSLLNKNIVPVVAAGNYSSSISYLITNNENSDKCVLVSAVKKDSKNSIQFDNSYSNYGKGIDFSAPGSSIKSAYIGESGDSAFTDKYKTISGTSMATPHVSATVALLSLGLKDDYTTDMLIDKLIDSALDYGTPGYDEYYGYGFINCRYLQYNKADVTIDIKVNNESLDLTKENKNIVYDEDLDLTIDCSDSSFVIKYTTNGTTPILSSNTYNPKLNVLTSDGYVNYNIIAYKLDNLGEIEEYTSMYNVSFIYRNAEVGKVSTVDSKGFITEYWGVHNNLVIPETVNGITITGIGEQALGWNENLESVELPKTCKHIGLQGFKMNQKLKYIYAPGVETIDFNAFGYCESLPFATSDAKPEDAQEGAYFPALKQFTETHGSYNVTYSGGVFYGCYSLQYVKLDSLEGCSKGSFTGLENLTSCILPNVESLYFELKNCDNLVEVDISNATSIIESFHNCESLKELYAPKLISIGKECFENCEKLEYVYAPEVTSIGENCFKNCEKLEILSSSDVEIDTKKGVFLPSLTTIDAKAFNGSYFKTLNLQGVKKIYYFGVMNYLEEIYLYDVEILAGTSDAIGYHDLFDDCSVLKKVVIGESVDNTSIKLTNDQVLYCFKKSRIHQIAVAREWKFELLNQYEFTNNLDSVIEKTENESLTISVDAPWGAHYQWYITDDNIENGVPLIGEIKKSIIINPSFDTNKKLFCKVISWDDSIQYSNIASIALDSSIQTYEIVFKNSDGQIIETKYMRKGQMPYYDADIPTKESSPQYDYTFKGWDKEFSEVNGNQEYIAQYDESLRSYKVSFLNYDGSVLKTFLCKYGSLVSDNHTITSFDAKKESTEKYYFTFKGWDKEFTTVTGDQEYTATFEENLRSYYIRFVNYDDSRLDGEFVYYGDLPEYTGSEPKRPKDVQYTYKFKGWDKKIVAVTGEETYRAVYDCILNQYLVTFFGYNNEILQSQLEFYGSIPVYQGTTPFKPSSSMFDYSFVDWYPLVQEVSGETNYYATFSSSQATTVSSLTDVNNLIVIEGNDNINEKWEIELNNLKYYQIVEGKSVDIYKVKPNVGFLTGFTIDIKQNNKIVNLDNSKYSVKLTLNDEYKNKKILLYYLTEDGSLIKVKTQKVNNQLLFDNINNATYVMLEDMSSTNYLPSILVAGLLAVILLEVVIIVIKKKKHKVF